MPTVEKDKRTDTACAWIENGDCNVAKIMGAVREYLATGAAEVGWVLNLDALGLPGLSGSLSASDLTIGEAADVAQDCGVGWDRINPLASAEQAVAVIKAVYVSRSGAWGDPDKSLRCLTQIRAIPSSTFEAAYEIAEKRPADPS